MVKEAEPRQFTANQAEKYLRGITTSESILNGMKRISLFKGIDAVKYLMNARNLSTSDAKTVISTLLDNHYIVRVRPSGDQHTLDISYDFNINHEYIWIKEGSKTFLFLMSILGLMFALTIAMFPIWPRSLKVVTGYLFYVLIGIVISLLSITVVRFVLYISIWLATRRSFWLFPNLYAECGILESFVPLYGWDQEEEEAGPDAAQKAEAKKIKDK
ncbi:translocation protein SEC62 [Nematocida minor]|uniref:translocation protein SEC62 n=1 Tax=Nematocida minor TaxID=1912983 RepID=UPI00221FEDA2|nr:translocation protein SEC62 [Nematocida minor]XP_051332034.1 translocation protein SEC62 [Nematocida minor]KAI5188764.1 translocation protein SEC62 [Nematocida minor]KAI5188868.1 translocation protein SEC62 [Nematocida minor]